MGASSPRGERVTIKSGFLLVWVRPPLAVCVVSIKSGFSPQYGRDHPSEWAWFQKKAPFFPASWAGPRQREGVVSLNVGVVS